MYIDNDVQRFLKWANRQINPFTFDADKCPADTFSRRKVALDGFAIAQIALTPIVRCRFQLAQDDGLCDAL